MLWRDRSIRGGLSSPTREGEHADPNVIAPLEQAILRDQPAVGHQGRAVIASRHGILIEEHLVTPRRHRTSGVGSPVHKPVSAGWNGYGDLQHTTEEAVRINVRAVARRIAELVDESGLEVVFVCGAVRTRSDVVAALPKRLLPRVCELLAGPFGHRVREQEVTDLMDAEFQRLGRHRVARRCATSAVS